MKLEVNALAFGYGRKRIGEGVSFTLQKGERLALLGPNGSGKTTLLKTLLGLLPAQAGNILINNADLSRLDERQKARLIAYVPQIHQGLFPFTVREMIVMGRVAHRSLLAKPSQIDWDRVSDAIQTLGLTALADQSFNEISGGERQLTLIARALVQETDLIILDEPTASLDFGNQSRVMRLIDQLSASGKAVLFTTHDPHHAHYHADHALLIRDGTPLALGPVSEVINETYLQELYQTQITIIQDGHHRAFLSSHPH